VAFDTSSAKPPVCKSAGDVVSAGEVDVTPPVGSWPGVVAVKPLVGRKPAEAEAANKQVKAIADRNRFMSCLLFKFEGWAMQDFLHQREYNSIR
jgi:hypothetical protein